MTDAEIAELRAGLEGVTPGPWTISASNVGRTDAVGITASDDEWVVADVWSDVPEMEKAAAANAAHIARCSPDKIAALLARLDAAEGATPEDTAEAFIQAAVDQSPEPLRRLGEWLAGVLDEDDWKTAERMLLGATVAVAWRDIATAPKDGTYVLVTNADAGGAWVAKYTGERAFIENPWMSMMLNTWHLPNRYHSFKPTHWMPLPSIAKAEG